MDSFLVVRPTGKPLNERVGAWVQKEMTHATNEWRRQFRGEARVKDDSKVTESDIAGHHLILWGDPASNQLLSRIRLETPAELGWQYCGHWQQEILWCPARAILIYPNPLNPKKYVVLNSGFTFREYDYLNNARQVAKLPITPLWTSASPFRREHPAESLMPASSASGGKWELVEPLKG
jgi:hypothetical protein